MYSSFNKMSWFGKAPFVFVCRQINGTEVRFPAEKVLHRHQRFKTVIAPDDQLSFSVTLDVDEQAEPI